LLPLFKFRPQRRDRVKHVRTLFVDNEAPHFPEGFLKLAMIGLQLVPVLLLQIGIEKNAPVVCDLVARPKPELVGAIHQPLVDVEKPVVGDLDAIERIEGDDCHDRQQHQYDRISPMIFLPMVMS